MKKLTAILILIISLLGLFPDTTQATSTGSFVVTAYYSPLPNQSAYIMGSYEAELRMNGEWIRWASGKPVFAGMLAAPQTYAFWTKIYLAWLGIGEVADRGGAIVSKGQRGFQHDRIDVWMWYGEEGLRRAMYWGNRTVKGYITYKSSAPTIKLANHPAPVWATAGLRKIPTSDFASSSVSNIYSLWIGSHSHKDIIIELQNVLKNNNFYLWELDGKYSSIEPIIYSYQLENWLVFTRDTLWAGYWGAITRSLFLKQFQNGTLTPPREIQETVEVILEKDILESLEEIEETIEETIEEVIEEEIEEEINIDIFSDTLTTAEEFRALQKILTRVWAYNWEIDGEYSSVRSSVFEYQIAKELVQNKSSVGAGVYGPKTRATLKKDYKELQDKKVAEVEEKIRLEEENTKREQEKIILQAESIEIEKEEKEKSIQMQARKEELVNIYLGLENTAKLNAEEKLNHIWLLQEWDVSQSVRELQLVMKDLWYFDHNDTAIYGPLTKYSIYHYQVDRWLVSETIDIWAWVFWPVTKEQMKSDLKTNILESLLFENEISLEELIEHGISL